MEDKPLYKPFRSQAKNKKYAVYIMKDGRKKKINFGDSRYQQFKDKIGEFSSLDHGDPKRRKLYFARHGRTTDKNTALYWSNRILW
tara:strand:- start:4470 stop:4727 length:258 start_codon:yes stop_codon:yes gene_type:complete